MVEARGGHRAGRRIFAAQARDKLRDAGNTVLLIEHNIDVVACCDWVIDLGPGGGEAGGTLVAEGTPESVASAEGSHTGAFLRERLGLAGRHERKSPRPAGASTRKSTTRSQPGTGRSTKGAGRPSRR